MTVGSDADIVGIERIGRIVAQTLAAMRRAAHAGISTGELDAIGARLLAQHGARSAPRLTYDFPGDTCISVNEEVAHGIPGNRRLEPGDVVNIDVSAELDGYFGDTGASFALPPVRPRIATLLRAARAALSAALAVARPGARLYEIGLAVQGIADRTGFRIVRNLASHGVGRALHEEPREILSYPDRRETRTLHEGQVITLEPFLSTRTDHVVQAGDGWTLLGPAGNRAAQFEHTLIVTRSGPRIATAGAFD